MSLTKVKDFKGIYFIPNALDVAPDSNLTGNSSELNDFIIIGEPKTLDLILGYELSQLLKPELLKKPFVSTSAETAAQIWIDLVNGKDNYRGLREILIASIFYEFYSNDFEQYTGTGTKTLESNNAVESSVRPRAIKAWRQMYDLAIGKFKTRTVIQTWAGLAVVHGELDPVYKSLFTFLRENEVDYPTWVERPFKNRTQHGL